MLPAGIGTILIIEINWLPGFIGPVPPPLSIREFYYFVQDQH
jgi:hypothetical protein